MAEAVDRNTTTPMETDQAVSTEDSTEDQIKCPVAICGKQFTPSSIHTFFSEIDINVLCQKEKCKDVQAKKDIQTKKNVQAKNDAQAKNNVLANKQVHSEDVNAKEDVKANTRDEAEKLKQLFCALLNTQEGNIVVFHVDDTRILEEYDRAWNKVLMTLVPDNSCYHDIFERVVLDDKHFRVRVKPHKDSDSCTMSTLLFHSSLSLDGGIERFPCHSNMQRVLENAKDETKCNADVNQNLPNDYHFILNEEVKVCGHSHTVPFQESMWLQAKRIGQTLKAEEMTHLMWHTHELGKYISAFSKVPRGGLIYFGICEKHDKPFKKFLCEGVMLELEDESAVKKCLNHELNEMLWLQTKDCQEENGGKPSSVGKLEFVRLSNKTRCIIKVTVYPFKGVCFFRKEGPESYVLDETDNPREVDDWAEWASNSHCENLVQVQTKLD